MILGQAESTLSSKNQIAFPKRFKKELGEHLILTKGFEKHLLVVSQDRWEMLLSGIEQGLLIDRNTRDIKRYLLGNSTEVVLDAKSRFILPGYLKEYSCIEAEIVFVGVGDYIEMWDKKIWYEYQEYLAMTVSGAAQRLAQENNK